MTSVWELLIVLISVGWASGINIIVFLPGTTEYERQPLTKIAQHLVFKNHGLSTFKGILIPEKRYLVKQKIHLARELGLLTGIPKEMYQEIEQLGNEIPWRKNYDTVDYIRPMWKAYANACEPVLNSDLMERIKQDKYDVALVYAGNPCNMAIVNAMAVPFIYFDMWGFTDETVAASATPMVPGVIPSSQTTFGPDMTFTERMTNVKLMAESLIPHTNNTYLMERFSERWRTLDSPTTELFRNDYELKKRFKYFPNMNEIKEQAALYFVNSDPMLEFEGRAVPPNVVYVGGAHMEFPRPLFEPWNTSMLDCKDGVIVVSFGMLANTSSVPPYFLRAFLGAFKRLPNYRFFVKISTPLIEGLSFGEIPFNVNLTQFIPQVDLLADKHTRLLISHGGIHSVMEAMFTGVPILGIPLFGPNYNNLRKVEAKGFGKILDKRDLTEKSLYRAIREVANPTGSYAQTAREISRAFKDRPMTPFETAIYWIEYVGRHHGGDHLDPKGSRHLYLFQHLLIDAAAAVLISAICLMWGVYRFFKMVYLRLCVKKPKTNQKATKKISEKSGVEGDSTKQQPLKNGSAGGKQSSGKIKKPTKAD